MFHSKRFPLHALALACAPLCVPLMAEAQSGPAAAPETADQTQKLGQVVVTGNPLRNGELPGQLQTLAGDALSLRRGPTLGETVDGLAGVSSSYFGPNSNRPTIRGLDGDRVRMLSNSGGSVDASSLSFDHAVPVDPLVIERIEVLRGAAALLYGGSALGGVVNTLDNRIPRQAQQGLSGVTELRLGGAAGERSGAAVLDGGDSGWAWHADVSARKAGNLRTPRFDSPEDGRSSEVRNSAAQSHGASAGASRLFDHGYAGVSVDDYRNDYGVTVEPDVTVRMQRQRLATAGEWRWTDGPLRRVQWQASRTRYEHSEVEGDGTVGTTFNSRGNDLRVEAEHAPLGDVRGVVGFQWERSNFAALGEEALVPTTHTRSAALFVLEQYAHGPWQLSAGARAESVQVASDGDVAGLPEPRFGSALTRKFSPKSLSLSGSFKLNEQWQAGLNISHSERAPMYYELFASGVHVATGAFERGDSSLAAERARGLDLSLTWQQAEQSVRASVYQTRFSNYIALSATGAEIEEEGGESRPEYAYRAVAARLQGFEIEWKNHLHLAGKHFTVGAQLDSVRGIETANGAPLPRLAPLRATLSLGHESGPWAASAELRLVARQERVDALDKATAGYGLVRLSLSRQLNLGGNDALWYLKLDNIGNKLAYNASSAATIRALAPLPGRSIHTGLQVRF